MSSRKFKPGRGEVESLRDLHNHIAQLLAKNTPKEKVIHLLQERGWPETTARQFVNNLKQEAGLEYDAGAVQISEYHSSLVRMLRDMTLIVFSLALIVVSLHLQDVYMGIYLFAMGVVLCVFESLDFMTGLADWWKLHK